MTHTTLRYAIMTSAFVGSMFVSPPESKAIFHWCKGCGQPAAVYPVAPVYAPPVVAAPAPIVTNYNPCNACAPPTTVSYVPQTAYRPVVVNTPVTTYQPVAGCGPCGNPVTTMRPVTTMVQTTQYVPYTSYRPVYSVGYAAPVVPQVVQYAPAPAPAPVAVQYAPAPPAPPTTVQYQAAPAPAPVPPPPCAPTVPQATVAPAPTPGPSPSDVAPRYDPNNPPTNPPDIRMKPTPEEPLLQYKAAPAATVPPQQAASEIDNRTAARPVTGTYRPVAATPVRPATATNDGWRPSGR
ncbi:MAG TPA: hypothetical protein VGJ26_10905 [Pirellulales bacterium]|jgi:hypothetical protein